MPSEKSRYLKNRPTPSITYAEIQSEIKNFSRNEIEDLLLNFSFRNNPLWRTVIVMTAISRFKNDGNDPALKKALLFALDLEDHVSYDRATDHRFVIYLYWNFLRRMPVLIN
jgi:hypothetical protein